MDNRSLYMRAIQSFGRTIGELKWFLKHYKGMTEAEAREAKSEIRRCEKELRQAKERLETGTFEDSIEKQIARAEAARQRATREFNKRKEEEEDRKREERERIAHEAHRQAVEKAKQEGRAIPATPPKTQGGRKIKALDYLFR